MGIIVMLKVKIYKYPTEASKDPKNLALNKNLNVIKFENKNWNFKLKFGTLESKYSEFGNLEFENSEFEY